MVAAEQYKKNKLLQNLARNIQLLVFDFDGVFTDNHVFVMQDGREAVVCWRGDGLGLSAIKALGVKVVVLSTETNSVVSKRCEKLGIPCIQSCADKAKALKQLAKESGVPLENVAYMGNDINDMGCLEIAGLPACVADSHPAILKTALYITKIKGGHGAVREFCDFIVAVKTGKISLNEKE